MSGGLKRFGAIGDIHGEDQLLERALEHLRVSSLDAILTVGDIVDGWGDVDRCCALLIDHGVTSVRGNHERWFLKGEMRNLPDSTRELMSPSRDYLETLPTTLEMGTIAGPLMLCHGVHDDDMASLTPDTRGYGLQAVLDPIRERDDLRFIVAGHTHQPMVRSLGPLTFINPGTLHRDFEAGYFIVDLEDGVVHRYALDHGTSPRLSQSLPLG